MNKLIRKWLAESPNFDVRMAIFRSFVHDVTNHDMYYQRSKREQFLSLPVKRYYIHVVFFTSSYTAIFHSSIWWWSKMKNLSIKESTPPSDPSNYPANEERRLSLADYLLILKHVGRNQVWFIFVPVSTLVPKVQNIRSLFPLWTPPYPLPRHRHSLRSWSLKDSRWSRNGRKLRSGRHFVVMSTCGLSGSFFPISLPCLISHFVTQCYPFFWMIFRRKRGKKHLLNKMVYIECAIGLRESCWPKAHFVSRIHTRLARPG